MNATTIKKDGFPALICEMLRAGCLLFLGGLSLLPSASSAASGIFASGLDRPIKLDITEWGVLVVSQTGSGDNDGRLSIVDRSGVVRPLISGLPSGIEVTGVPSGPTAVQLRGCCALDLAIGEGDTLRFAPPEMGLPPGGQTPNPIGATSPLFSSVLHLVFNYSIAELAGGFVLTPADHERLADGFVVQLANDSGEKVWVRLVTDIKDFRPDPVTNVRGSNPFGMTYSKQHEKLLIADGGGNNLLQIDSARPKTLLRFAPVPNPTGVVPPLTDAVPTSVRHLNGDLFLVTLFAGVPFAEGTSSVRLVNIGRRTQSILIPRLTTASDVLKIGSAYYVLEFFPGRLLRFSTPSSAGQPVAEGLAGPSSMVYSARQRAIYITELFAGQIHRVDLE